MRLSGSTILRLLARYRELLREDVELFTYIQFLFFRQWTALKSYINSLGIGIIGDLPIYVAMDSADVWAEPVQCSSLDEPGRSHGGGRCAAGLLLQRRRPALGQSPLRLGRHEAGRLRLVDPPGGRRRPGCMT